MLSQIKIAILLITCTAFFSSCKSTDPFKQEIQKSTINLAVEFAENFVNPSSKKMIKKAYEQLSEISKDNILIDTFLSTIVSRYPSEQIYKRKMEIMLWEKFDLSDGSSLVYLLQKDNFSILKMKLTEYAVLRVHLIRENNNWVIDFGNESKQYLDIIASGDLETLTDEKIVELKNMLNTDVADFQFEIDITNSVSNEVDLTEKCIQEGEVLYDKEEYRKSLMQFQKALSIDPENTKAKTYISRCKKALSFVKNKK